MTTRTAPHSRGMSALSNAKRLIGTVTVAVVLLTLPGCSHLRQWVCNGFKVGRNYAEPHGPVAVDWVDHANSNLSNMPAQDSDWWTVFNDPALDGLIDTAYRQNLDLRAVAARIVEARSRRSIAVGNLFPQSQRAVSLYSNANVTRNLGVPIPSPLNIWADGFNASWEPDFWGRYRRMIEASDANLDAAGDAYGTSLVLLLSEVATNYVQLRTFQQRLTFARENVVIQQRSADLAQTRFDAGTTTELDLRQAKASLAQTKATIPPLLASIRLAGNQLCVLMGTPVTELESTLLPAGIPTAPPEVAVGIPADLLRRRPDVRRAERLVAAQSAQIGIAEADFYPRLSVNGFIGYAANDFADVFKANSLTTFVLPTMQWNILNYGRIRNNVRAQDAVLRATTFEYQQAVLNAGREVEDALVQFVQAQQQTEYLEAGVIEARRAVEIAQVQFEGGVIDFNRVDATQTQLVAQQDQLGTARGNSPCT